MNAPLTIQSQSENGRTPFGQKNTGEDRAWIPATHLLLGAVLVATFAAYARTLSFQFVYDDHPWLMDNPALHSWRYVGNYFTKHLWAGVGPYISGNYYRPVFMLWARINVWLFGAHPMGYHFGAVSLHVLVTLLVFFLALRISSNRNHAALASLIFGLHPVHIESVAWILGSTDSFAGVFTISAFLCWDKSRDPAPASRHWRVASWVLFGFGLLAKEVALILPLLIMVHDYVSREEDASARDRRTRLRMLRESLRAAAPFIIVIIPYLGLRIWVLHGFSHPAVDALAWRSIPLALPMVFWFYVRQLMWPVHLTIYYDLPSVVPPSWQSFIVPLLGGVAVIVLLVCGMLKSKVIRMGASWFFIPLIPGLDLRVFSSDDLVHDRFLYFASIGYAIIVAYVILKLPAAKTRLFGYPALQGFLAVALAVSLGVATVVESAYFQDDWHFLNYIYSAAPRNLYATQALGRYWRQRGRYDESAKFMEECVKDHPGDWDATYYLGRDYYKLGRFTDAISPLTRATLLDPSAPGPYLDLGLSWLQLGQYDRAEAAFREAIKLRPDGYGYHFALGMAVMKQGRDADALEQFKKELRLHPDDSAAKLQIAQMSNSATHRAP